jgi:ATP adenylyltransferase
VTGLERLWAGWRSVYIEGVATEPPKDDCLFCALAQLDDAEAMVLERTPATFTVMNAYPYTSGHVMVAPLRHEGTLVGLDDDEASMLMLAARRASAAIDAAYRPEGQNAGVNIGRAAGAGVPGHLHVHVLPRWAGDTNFTTAVAETRVLPESLQASYEKLRGVWPSG